MGHHLPTAAALGALAAHTEGSGPRKGVYPLAESLEPSVSRSTERPAADQLVEASALSPSGIPDLEGAPRLLPALKAAALVSGGAASTTLCAVGFGLLVAVVLCNALLPPRTSFTRPLYFDYTQPAAFARTSFLAPDLQTYGPDTGKVLPVARRKRGA